MELRWNNLCWIAGLAWGCRESAPESPTVVRDSAGIEIVENVTTSWDEGDGWLVDEMPEVTIGVAEGASEYQLYRATPLRLDDGRIVIANAGTGEIRFFDPAGGFIEAVGGEGSGPGEFSSMGPMWVSRDSLYLFDWRELRWSVFSQDGEFGRVFRLERPGEMSLAWPFGVFGNGEILAYQNLGVPGADAVLQRDSILLWRYAVDGSSIDTVGRTAGDEMVMVREAGNVFGSPAPFGYVARVAVLGERFWLGTPHAFQIEERMATGELRRIVRLRRSPSPVTDADVAAYLAENAPDGPLPPVWRRIQEAGSFPETMPPYGKILVSGSGYLWVGEYRWRDPESRWLVFEPGGFLLGAVETPAGVELVQVGDGFVLGVWRDQLDVEQVRLYRVEARD